MIVFLGKAGNRDRAYNTTPFTITGKQSP